MHENILEYEERNKRILTEDWKVGFHDRGHGNGDFGVITESDDLVVGKITLELAEHLVELHNSEIK